MKTVRLFKVQGREAEKEQIQEIVESPRPEFLAVYGRRRVGKTFLIREFFDNKFTFYATGLANANTLQQLTNFTIFFNKAFNASTPVFKDWYLAFNGLITELEKRKGLKIIFLDELPWFDTKRSDFITGLEYFWNSWASAQKDLKLIVCGSATSWIMNKLINNHGGLHNRLTAKIKLHPFTLYETEQFLQSKNLQLDRYQIVQLYMVMGGIPYYLEQVRPGLSATQNIQKLCFDKTGLLRTEFNFIFSSLFGNGEMHEEILKRIFELGGSANRENILANKNFSSGGEITKKLKELEECGFITTYYEYGIKSAKKVYAISDFYTLFYFKFIEKGVKSLQQQWLSKIDHPAVRAWSGFSFEQVCIQHVRQITDALKFYGVAYETSVWRKKGDEHSKGSQIDLVIDRRDKVINLFEIKFAADKYTVTNDYDMELRHKVSTFKATTKTKKAVWLTMITTFGLVENKYSRSIIYNEITLDDLFLKKPELRY